MYPALVVLWLGVPAPTVPPPDLTRWAAQRGFHAVPVPPAAEAPYAADAAQEIESLLEETRSLSPGAAQLERLDELLAQHPELPQAGWWLAERYALEQQQASADAPANAARLEQRRAALEGPRAATAGGAAAAAAGPSAQAGPLELLGLRSHDQLVLDGEPVRAGQTAAPGRHHAQLFRAQRRVWAGWIEIDSTQLQLPEISAPCTDIDLLGTEYAPEAPRPAPGVKCPAWAAAHSSGPGRVELALCRADRCELWQVPNGGSSASLAASRSTAEAPERLPAWLTWGALGLGLAAGTTLVLWQAGAFDRSPPATEFVFTGPSAAAVRF